MTFRGKHQISGKGVTACCVQRMALLGAEWPSSVYLLKFTAKDYKPEFLEFALTIPISIVRRSIHFQRNTSCLSCSAKLSRTLNSREN